MEVMSCDLGKPQPVEIPQRFISIVWLSVRVSEESREEKKSLPGWQLN